MMLRNFLGFGNQPTHVDFQAASSTIVIAPNGSGKTALLLDSLYFALTGTTFRSINKDLILNTYNMKETEVVLNMKVDGVDFEIRRGLKPDVFDIIEDGVHMGTDLARPARQKWLDKRLNLDKSTIENLIFVSAAGTPFMRMSGPERRSFVEKVLKLEEFTVIHDGVKAKIKDLKAPLTALKGKLEGKNETLSRLNTVAQNSSAPDKALIEESKEKLLALTEKLPKGIAKKNELNAKVKEFNDTLRTIRSSYDQKKAVYDTKAETVEQLKSGICPFCKGEVSNETKEHWAHTLEHLKAEVQALGKSGVEKKAELDEIDAEFTDVFNKVEALTNEINRLTNVIASEEAKQTADVTPQIDEVSIEIAELVASIDDMQTDFDDWTEIDKVLKSGSPKVPIISDYIPFFNEKVNEYLDAFNLPIMLELDSEFNERIRSRFRDQFVYDSFSTGQQKRIDFAILMAWRDITKKLSSVSTNILIVDEFGDKLDDEGVEAFAEALNHIDDHVFCLTPKPVPGDFEKTIKLEVVAGFSTVK
jgi:DNA repair exonuclease SbcCD ATPase subunit